MIDLPYNLNTLHNRYYNKSILRSNLCNEMYIDALDYFLKILMDFSADN